MIEFQINYAYNGFLYAPLILADHLKLLPHDARLMSRGGDVETLNSLGAWHDPRENWFAVCDPFATDITRLALPPYDGKPDAVCIVGALIGRLPVWLYSLDSEVKRTSSEIDLKEYRHRIKRIICYEKFNTGYLIGRRINDLIFGGDDKTRQAKFGEELEKAKADDLVVTSDVLKVAQSQKLNDGHVVFDYFAHSEDLDPFLFTAILTLRSVVNNRLHTVLSVLKGIQEATLQFETGTVSESEENVGFLASTFKEQMPAQLSDQERCGQVRDAIELLARDKIYSGNLDIDTAAMGYEKARKAWLVLRREYGPVEKHKEPIPSLLIQKDWPLDPPLARAFAETWKFQRSAAQSQKGKLPPVKAVAETWRDDEQAVTVVTQDWLSSSVTETLLRKMIGQAEPAQAAEAGPHELEVEYRPPVVMVALAELSLLVVGIAAISLGGQFRVAVSTVVAILLFAIGSLLLVSYWSPKERNTAFWWVALISFLGQMVLTVWISRDAFYRDERDQWGHHEGILTASLTIVILLATKHAAEPLKKLPEPLRKLLAQRQKD